MNNKKFVKLKEKGEIGFADLKIKEIIQLARFFDIYVDGDKKKVILKEI